MTGRMTALRCAGGLLMIVMACGCGNKSRESRDGYGASSRAGGYATASGASQEPEKGDLADHTPIPSTLSGLWIELAARRAQLREAAASAHFDSVRTVASRIRKLGEALGPLSGQYVSTRQGPLTDNIRRIDEISGALVVAASSASADSESIRRDTADLENVFRFVGRLYPPGVLPDSTRR